MEKAQEALDDFDYAKYGEEPKDYYEELKGMDWNKYDQASLTFSYTRHYRVFHKLADFGLVEIDFDNSVKFAKFCTC